MLFNIVSSFLSWISYVTISIIEPFFIILPLLIAVAYFTLAERKILGAIHKRLGPNVIGLMGMLQPLSDGLKLFLKETVLPSNADISLFVLAPMLTFTLSLMGWVVIPYSKYAVFADIDCGLLYIFAVSSLSVYGILLSGWSSNSKYAFLGALRSAAQMISYEVSIGFIIVTIILCTGSFNLTHIIESQKKIWFVIPFLPLFLIFFISSLAETNRHPFDLPEAEAELVSGYNVEYSAMGFAFFSLGEYSNMLLMSALNVIFFFGGWLPLFSLGTSINVIWFGLKVCFFVILFILARAALPRLRYDQLMDLGWKSFLPISLCYVIFFSFFLLCFNCLPF